MRRLLRLSGLARLVVGIATAGLLALSLLFVAGAAGEGGSASIDDGPHGVGDVVETEASSSPV